MTVLARPVQNGADEADLEPNEFVLEPAEFDRIVGILHRESGILLARSKSRMVYSRLAKRLRSLGLESFQDYCLLVTARNGAAELRQMVSALTTNVTHFFREPHHFEHLRDHALPPLLEAAKRGERVRIWSAACSTGEEAYSIALTVLSMMPDAGSLDLKILATDIDSNVVETAAQGIYPREFVETVPDEARGRYIRPAPVQSEEFCKIDDRARSLIAFRELNLISGWPIKGVFQIIFCRNVVIYFDEPTKEQLWERFAEVLTPGGCLYVGHSERVSGPANQAFCADGVTTYRRLEGGWA